MTGLAFIVYTFYMITDPATAPRTLSGQLFFGLGNAFFYSLLMISHIVFGLFFALTFTCLIRGLILYVKAQAESRAHREHVIKVPGDVEQVPSTVG
jgi:Na+-translocating ferredoxin:NAD+ oxidoreductase RnfD subunit